MESKLNLTNTCTRREYHEINFSWSVENFSTYDCNHPLIKSEIFPKFDEFKWRLQLYPHGNRDDYKEYVSIFLKFMSHEKGEIERSYKFSLKNKDGKLLKDYPYHTHKFCKLANNNGCSTVIKRSELLPLNDDTLIVNCSVKWETEIVIIHNEPEKINVLSDQNQLSTDFKQLVDEGTFSDVSILAKNGTEFSAHKCVLSVRSPVFSAMFKHDTKENQESIVKIEDFDANVVKQLLQFMYTNKVDENTCDMDELLAAADKYDLKQLKTYCEYELCEKLQIDNLAVYLSLADRHNAEILKKRSLELLATYPKDIINTETMECLAFANPSLFYNSIKTVFN